jgi:hypothetical protein
MQPFVSLCVRTGSIEALGRSYWAMRPGQSLVTCRGVEHPSNFILGNPYAPRSYWDIYCPRRQMVEVLEDTPTVSEGERLCRYCI